MAGLKGWLRSAALVAMVLGMPRHAVAQTAAEFFDSGTLQDVQLLINSRDLARLRAQYDQNTYYPADLVWRGVRVRNAAVRVRGLSTRSGTKPGLRIDFDRYLTGQRFLGLSALVLDNTLTDPAVIRERTSMAFISRMEQPASREAFARLFINGTYQGVYVLVEPVDTEFLARNLFDGGGYLFNYSFTTAFHAEDLGDDLRQYKERFVAETHRLEPDSILYGPIRDLFREVNHDVDAVWRDRVSNYIDLQQLVTYLAIEMFLAEDDGMLGGAGMANFYLYRPISGGPHRVVPWDRDTTFFAIDKPIFERVDTNVLISRVLAFDDLRVLYLAVLERCAQRALEDGWLEQEILRASTLIRPSVYEDSFKRNSNEEFEQAISYLIAFARQRSISVLEQVAQARR
jgi:spore coat protein H